MANATQKLEIKSLQKATKTSLVMDEVDITVHEGEIFALVGGPKSCKTLLSKIVVNLVKLTSGEVIIGGKPGANPKKTFRKIGASLEQQKFHPHKTAIKTLEQHAIVHRHAVTRSDIVNTLNLVDLKKTMHNTISRFDESAIARLKIAVAIYTKPEILILDDPFKNLSDEEAGRIRTVIKTIADVKKTAVLITAQEITDVEDICDTIGIIDDGMMVMVKSYNQFFRDDALHERVRVHTQSPSHTAQVIEKDLGYKTSLCGEWVVIETLPASAQTIADALYKKDIKIFSMQRVNRSLQEQFFEIITAHRNSLSGGET